MSEKKEERVVVAPEEKQEQPLQGKPDETVEGGRYLVNGVLVDANGQPLKDKR